MGSDQDRPSQQECPISLGPGPTCNLVCGIYNYRMNIPAAAGQMGVAGGHGRSAATLKTTLMDHAQLLADVLGTFTQGHPANVDPQQTLNCVGYDNATCKVASSLRIYLPMTWQEARKIKTAPCARWCLFVSQPDFCMYRTMAVTRTC